MRANNKKQNRIFATTTLLAGLIMSNLLSSCGGASAGLGTSSSPCFSALPPAFQAAGTGGRMIGVRLLSSKNAVRLEHIYNFKNSDRICLIAFEFPNPKSGKITVTKDMDRVIGNFRLVFYDLTKAKMILVHNSKYLPIKFAHSFALV